MTVEIRELVIQARVTSPDTAPPQHFPALSQLSHMEHSRLVDTVTRAVLEKLRDEQERR